MEINLNLKTAILIQILILAFLISCHQEVKEYKECTKFADEKYIVTTIDTSMKRGFLRYQAILLGRFRESSIKGLDHEAYFLQFYSSHGYGKSVRFDKNSKGGSLSVKCHSPTNTYRDCKEYQIEINVDEWNVLEKMIYDFNFWTEADFGENREVLDGYTYLLEGNRPQASKCNKKTYHLTLRGSPNYDKIGALCEYIFEYESQLDFRYHRGK